MYYWIYKTCLGKGKVLPSIWLISPNEFDKFNNTEVRLQDFIWATMQENLSSGFATRLRLKQACSAAEAS